MKKSAILVAIAFATLPALVNAQTPMKAGRKAAAHASLKSQTKISEADAKAIALKDYPNGTVKSAELEKEKGHLVYSFDITTPGKNTVDEILIDAVSGKVVSREVETPRMQKAEARKEAREAKIAAKAAARKK